MPHTFVPPFFLGSCDPAEADIALFGVCWDGTSSFKAGSRFAGFAVREASFGMEEFSFYQQASLMDVRYADLGDLFLPPCQKERVLADIGGAVRELRAKKLFPLAFGGEHLVALPLILAAFDEHPDLALIHFDAHADLRPEMWDDPLTHATVIARAADKIGWKSLFQFGIRSGSAEEWELAQRHGTQHPFSVEAIDAVLERLGDRPLYVTLDMDVLDPSLPLLRARALYDIDTHKQLRRSHENPAIEHLYAEFLGEPNGEKAHELLHTHYNARMPRGIR